LPKSSNDHKLQSQTPLISAPPTGWRKYLEYLEFLATDAKAQKELVVARMSRG
jgi:hypothetical protein